MPKNPVPEYSPNVLHTGEAAITEEDVPLFEQGDVAIYGTVRYVFSFQVSGEPGETDVDVTSLDEIQIIRAIDQDGGDARISPVFKDSAKKYFWNQLVHRAEERAEEQLSGD
jgi:hypothetical protein